MTNSSATMQKSVSNTALPSALANLTERVIRGTRLWRSEKRDVRAELESHFREGLEELAGEGLTEEAAIRVLCDSFGNPELTAKLIRRGKKRGRPMIVKIAISASIALLGAAGAGGAYVAYLTYAKPNPSIDYLETLNESIVEHAEEQRAWPVLRDTLLQFKPMPESLSALNPADVKPGSADWTAVQAWLETNRPLIPALAAAASKPYYGFVYGGSDTGEFMRRLAEANSDADLLARAAPEPDPLAPRLISLLLPHLADVRTVAWFLVYDARDHAAAGRYADAWSSLDLDHRLAAKLFEGKTLIEQLVGAAVMRMTCGEMRRILGEHGDALPPEMYATIVQSHLFTMQDALLVPHLDGERLMFQDAVQYVFTDDGGGNGRLIPSQFAKLQAMGTADESANDGFGVEAGLIATAARHADRRDTLAKYEELWNELARYRNLPLHDPNRALGEQRVAQLADSDEGRKYAARHLDAAEPQLRGSADSRMRHGQRGDARVGGAGEAPFGVWRLAGGAR
ncbi:MAG: hypothetical protein IPK83_08590 [Planctomycetes bacterium]|nr:hypothetical protein [Planctomycetota bacterium]